MTSFQTACTVQSGDGTEGQRLEQTDNGWTELEEVEFSGKEHCTKRVKKKKEKKKKEH